MLKNVDAENRKRIHVTTECIKQKVKKNDEKNCGKGIISDK